MFPKPRLTKPRWEEIYFQLTKNAALSTRANRSSTCSARLGFQAWLRQTIPANPSLPSLVGGQGRRPSSASPRSSKLDKSCVTYRHVVLLHSSVSRRNKFLLLPSSIPKNNMSVCCRLGSLRSPRCSFPFRGNVVPLLASLGTVLGDCGGTQFPRTPSLRSRQARPPS